MQVVPTEYRYLSKEVLPTNQFSVNEYFVPMKPNDKSWPGTISSRIKVPLLHSMHYIDKVSFPLMIQLYTSCTISLLSLSQLKKKDAVFFIF